MRLKHYVSFVPEYKGLWLLKYEFIIWSCLINLCYIIIA